MKLHSKLILVLALSLLLLGASALASETVYIDAEPDLLDLLSGVCYHATPLCIDAGETTDAISEDEAISKGLLPCPICVQEAPDAKGVRAVARGGTYVLAMLLGSIPARTWRSRSPSACTATLM